MLPLGNPLHCLPGALVGGSVACEDYRPQRGLLIIRWGKSSHVLDLATSWRQIDDSEVTSTPYMEPGDHIDRIAPCTTDMESKMKKKACRAALET